MDSITDGVAWKKANLMLWYNSNPHHLSFMISHGLYTIDFDMKYSSLLHDD